MKKWFRYITVLLAVLMLTGCGKNAAQTMETVLDVAEVILDAASEQADEEEFEADYEEVLEDEAEALEEAEEIDDILIDSDEDTLSEEVSSDSDFNEQIAEANENTAGGNAKAEETARAEEVDELPLLKENGSYNSKDDVALYIYQYGKLPSNYLTKKEAESLGWSGGSLEPYAPGKSIGGSRFGNYEKILPTKKGRTYTECDIDTKGKKSRGAKRIVFSNDGLIYYTDDHYASFELLYGEE